MSCNLLRSREPARLEVCALLDKPSRREVPIKATWTGFEIPDEFVVGYGIDFAQRNRNLPYIGKVRFTEPARHEPDLAAADGTMGAAPARRGGGSSWCSAVIALCLALVGIERFLGWPDWLTVNGRRDCHDPALRDRLSASLT